MRQDEDLAQPEAGGRAVGSFETERVARREAEAAAERLARLQSVTAALSGARTPDEVAAVALGVGIDALGGTRGFVLAARPGGTLEVLRCVGVTEDAARTAAAPEPGGPAWEAFRSGAAIFATGDEPFRDGPEAARAPGRMAALPLAIEGRALGVLAVFFERARPFGDSDRAFALGIAGQCAQALDRARLLVAERVARAEAVTARRRLAFLDGLSAHLAETADRAEMLDGVARLSVLALGEWVGIYVQNDGGGFALAAQRGPPALGAAVDGHLKRGAIARIERKGGCGDITVVDDLAAVPAVVLVPLTVRGRSLGALAVATEDPWRTPRAEDIALLADVAHRTALALEHMRLLDEANAAARAREEFLHVASHELRAPIATLGLTVDLLRRDTRNRDPAATERRLRVLERQAARLLGLSKTLLDVSRITAGRLDLAREPADLAALVREVAARFADEAADRGASIAVDAPGPLRCELDVARMDQVVSNLVSNAVKYGRGAPIRVTARAEGARAVIEVEDRGIGIAPEHQERIFGRFERAVSGRNYPGLGLGLWIVRRLVESHGGAIRVRSAPGAGSTFVVELPVSPA